MAQDFLGVCEYSTDGHTDKSKSTRVCATSGGIKSYKSDYIMYYIFISYYLQRQEEVFTYYQTGKGQQLLLG